MKSATSLRKKVLVIGLEHYQNKLKNLKARTDEWQKVMKEYQEAKEKLKALCKK
jgi:hypothetical protein